MSGNGPEHDRLVDENYLSKWWSFMFKEIGGVCMTAGMTWLILQACLFGLQSRTEKCIAISGVVWSIAWHIMLFQVQEQSFLLS